MGPQDIMAPAGPQAEHLLELWWIMIAVCGLVFIAVLAALFWALARAPRAAPGTPPDLGSLGRAERGARLAVAAALALSGALLVLLMVASFVTDRALARLAAPDLRIDVTAHKWWWEARYDDSDPSRTFTTANELHIPVGKSVLLRLGSDDVIHSLWVPNLAGKKDLIPGRQASLALQAKNAGTYRGQCAEFCGVQHAKMAFLVIAHEPDDYEAWAAAQRKPALEPATAQQKRGREIFLSTTCAMCHAIQGTSANARRAPDLTHLASRQTIAAGTLPMSKGNLYGWVADPQSLKPGTKMPTIGLEPNELHSVVAYLETLK